MQTVNVPGIEHVYGFQRDSPSGYTISTGGVPLRNEEPGPEHLLPKITGAGKSSSAPPIVRGSPGAMQ